MRYTLLPLFAFLLCTTPTFALECQLEVKNNSTVAVKVTVSGLMNNKFIDAGDAASYQYDSSTIGWVESYQVPITVLTNRFTLFQGLWIMGGSVIGQELAPPSFFRNQGSRSRNLRFTVNDQAYPVDLRVICK